MSLPPSAPFGGRVTPTVAEVANLRRRDKLEVWDTVQSKLVERANRRQVAALVILTLLPLLLVAWTLRPVHLPAASLGADPQVGTVLVIKKRITAGLAGEIGTLVGAGKRVYVVTESNLEIEGARVTQSNLGAFPKEGYLVNGSAWHPF